MWLYFVSLLAVLK
ncbi:putative Ig heavy chain V-III region VH26 protein, partial [Naja naja]